MTSIGDRVRTVIELIASDDTIIRQGSSGVVIGHAGNRPVVEFHDRESDIRRSVVAEPWEVRVEQPRTVRS